METFSNYHRIKKEYDITYPCIFLYHGLRSGNQIEKLASILKSGILAGKYLDYFSNYSDNCNEGEYVSLLEYSFNDKLEYNTFVKPNIALIVSPLVEAYKTTYVSYDTWEKVHKNNDGNLYSYARYEYLVKDKVDQKYFRAVGIPYKYIQASGKKEEYINLKEEVLKLLDKYNINISIIDHSDDNKILIKDSNK